MAYQPTAADFEDVNDDEGYTPSAEDFEEEESGSKPLELTLTKPAKPQELKGWKGLGHDAIELLRDTLKGGIGFARRAPSNLKEIGKDLIEHPLSTPPHIAQQVLAGLAGGTRDLLNVPHKIFDELADKEITPNWLRTGSIPEDLGVEKALGLEPTKKSDELLRALPAIYGGGKLLAPGVKAAKKAITAPSKEKLFQRALEERIDKAADKTQMSKEQLQSLKDALKLDYSKIHGETLGEASPVSLQEKINVAENKLAEKKPLTEIPEEHVGEIPEAPDTKGMIEKHKKAVEAAHEAAEANLGIKSNPSLGAGQKIKTAIKDVKSSAEDLYKASRNHYVNEKISADNTAEIKAATKELEAMKDADELAPGYGSGTAEQKALESQIEALKGEKVNASDIFDLQRTLETMAENTRTKQFAGKVPELEFKRLGNIAERLDKNAEKLATRLESVGGKEVQKMMKEANKGWRTYKQLTKENPIGKAAMKGNIPNQALIRLAEDHPANDFLKGMVESDPELRKQFLAAYSGESNVKKLLKPSSVVKDYIKSLPEVEEHVQALKNAITEFNQGKGEASKIEREHKALVDSMKEAANRQKIRKEAIEESDKLKKQIQFKKDAIPKIEAEMKKVAANSAEHKKLQKELDEHHKFIEDKGGRLKELAKLFVKIKVIGKLPG